MKKITPYIFLMYTLLSFAQVDPFITQDSLAQTKWVDSLMQNMTLEQKIGQLFMVPAFSNKDQKHIDHIEHLVKKYELGGLIFMQGTAEGHATLINRYQAISKLPLMISIDGEWGLDMRLKNTIGYPYNMALGAIRNDRLLYDMGQHLAQQVKRLGIHVDFAPVVDINTNPKNPVIGNRSYGENKYNVTNKALQFGLGLQSGGVIACLKHFPGHGDTAQDSHKTLPTVDLSVKRLHDVELYPYKELFQQGIGSVITAHLSVPSLESQQGVPTSVSHAVVTDLLQKNLQFKGLIFTDALNMKGASDFVKPGEIDLNAFKAGNDFLLFPENVPAGIGLIKKAILSKEISKERLDHSVRKILKAKYWLGLNDYQPTQIEGVQQDVNKEEYQALNQLLVENSVTLVKNGEQVLPIKKLSKNKIAYVKLGKHSNSTFVKRLKDYANIDVVNAPNLSDLIKKLEPYQTVIVSFHTSLGAYASYKIANQDLVKLQEIARKKKVILDVFASPYALLGIKSFTNIDAVVVSYQNTKLAQDISAQMIFGALDMKGKLPVSINNEFKEGHGLYSKAIQRLSYGVPESVGMSSQKLNRIDSIANVVIEDKIAPGLQVLVARHGKVVYRKSFGFYTYDAVQKVDNNSIYDLASVTKILGGLPMIMRAEEEGKFNLESTLGDLMPVLKDSDKDTLTVKEVLAHYGKLEPYIPYYRTMVEGKDAKPMAKYFSDKRSKKFDVKVADKLYLRTDYYDTIFKRIAEVPQRKDLRYRYSGLPFYLFKDYIEKAYKKSFDQINNDEFYAPLGANTLTYNPLQKFSKKRIVPTEDDQFFRHQLLHGYVHDEGAAMMGGVSGNAGLFANSNDVAKMMQMYLQKGYYGGESFFKPETLDTFNQRYYQDGGNRRGLAFDKPQLADESMATCGCVSFKSFGHSGYTGTYTFADPESEIVYVFLSNRVYPTRKNNKISKENIRTKVQQLIQEAIVN